MDVKTEKSFVVRMNAEDAGVLLSLLGCVRGSSTSIGRKATDALHKALTYAGAIKVKAFNEDQYIEAIESHSAIGGSIRWLPLTVRTRSQLEKNGIFDVDDFEGKTESDILKIPLIGRNQLNEIKTELQKVGIFLPKQSRL